jgi:hypothetical protein
MTRGYPGLIKTDVGMINKRALRDARTQCVIAVLSGHRCGCILNGGLPQSR